MIVNFTAAGRTGFLKTARRRIPAGRIQVVAQRGQHPVDLATAELQYVRAFAYAAGRLLVDVEREPQATADAVHRLIHPCQRTFELRTRMSASLRPPQLRREYGQVLFLLDMKSRKSPQ